jgi:hypothetical protein
MRTRWAFLLAPVIPAILPGYNLHMHRPETTPISGFIFICLVFYFLQAVIGIPAFYILARRRWQYFWLYTAIGFFGAFVPIFILCLFRWNALYTAGTVLYGCSFIGVFGGVTSLIFWLLVRPDRDPVAELASHFS